VAGSGPRLATFCVSYPLASVLGRLFGLLIVTECLVALQLSVGGLSSQATVI